MRKNTSKRLMSLALSFLMLSSAAPYAVFAADDAAEAEKTENKKSVLQELSESLNTISYADYLEKYADVEKGTKTIVLNATDYDKESTDAEVKVVNDYMGMAGEALQIGDDGKVTWKFSVDKEGKYAIKLRYCSISDKINSVERTLYINDAVPFAEARFLLMKKSWVNEYIDGRFEFDSNGNEIRPTTSVLHDWKTYHAVDSKGYYANPFEFVLNAGENTISLDSVREPVVIKDITIYPYEDRMTYDEYTKKYLSEGKTEAVADPIYLDAELPSKTSDYTVYPVYDRKSPISEPQHASKIMLNTIGGEKWSTAGKYVEYEFEVAAEGFYEIVFRYRQNLLSGMYTSRKIYIDDEIPFEEANYTKYNYDSGWQVDAIGNGADTFQFYLTPGKHTLKIEASLGEMGPVIDKVNAILKSINNDYLEILKYTGASPDQYRDYGFGRVLPDVVIDLLEQSQKLDEVITYIESMGDIKSQNTATLEQISRLLYKMGTDESEIAKNLKTLKEDIGTLGEWINDVNKQPLEIDWIRIQPASAEKPKAEAGFFSSLIYEIKQFIASFFTDYNSLGSDESDKKMEKTIDVWVSTGRDQAQIIRNLMDNDFGPDTGINAKLKLIAGGTLLPSVLAGVGPEVSLGGVDAVQYAIRDAVIAVNPEAYEDQPGDDEETKKLNAERREIFSNFHEIEKRFPECAMVPITLYGKTYALPDTMSWPMLFYRTDILADLGLEVPETWDDLIAMIPVLQFNNMEIGMSQDSTMFLYQMDGEYWADEGMRTNLDSNLALESFETMCNMFTQYSLPIQYDAANRFRTGEMPIFISGYTTYNNIVIFATEIAGLWEFGPIPGTLKEDGTIDNTAMAGIGSIVMMRGARDVESAWKFMCWYTDKEFQVDYSNELVAIMGDAAKNATANLEALEELPWTSREYEQLMKQMEHTDAIEPYPGSYIIGRYTSFSFLAAYNEGKDPVDSFLGYITLINKEINRKRTEFDLETLAIGETLASKRLGQAKTAIEALDDSVKSSASVTAALAAIESEDIEALKSAATALGTSDAALAEIAGYLTDAAKALESYIE